MPILASFNQLVSLQKDMENIAQKLADEHIANGGALTDKYGLSAY